MNKPTSLILILIFVLISGCTSEGHENTSPGYIHWVTYRNEAVGYEVKIPDIYNPIEWEDGSGVAFKRNGNETVMLVRWANEADKSRGIWLSHNPNGTCVLFGQSGRTYDYIHYDGPFGIRTRSWVIPYKNRELGVEFRMINITKVEKQILDSFRLITLE
jgi:hypothetical protein